jgi:seryl-tRNA synthetase
MDQSVHIVDEWYSIDAESKMNEKIDRLQKMVNEQSQTIHTLLEEIKLIKSEFHSSHHQSSNQNDRTHQLLDELKVLKERELNIMIREKIPVPFYPIPSFIFTKKTIPSPHKPL